MSCLYHLYRCLIQDGFGRLWRTGQQRVSKCIVEFLICRYKFLELLALFRFCDRLRHSGKLRGRFVGGRLDVGDQGLRASSDDFRCIIEGFLVRVEPVFPSWPNSVLRIIRTIKRIVHAKEEKEALFVGTKIDPIEAGVAALALPVVGTVDELVCAIFSVAVKVSG